MKKRTIVVIVVVLLAVLLGAYALVMQRSKANELYTLGVEAYQAGDYATAKEYFSQAKSHGEAKRLLQDITYNEAVAAFDAGDYDRAEATFKEMPEYKDAQHYLYLITYADVQALMTAGDYEAANILVQELIGHIDVGSAVQEINYQRALRCVDAADAEGAKTLAATLADSAKAKYIYDVIQHTQDAVVCVKDLISRYAEQGTTIVTVLDARYSSFTYSDGTYVPLYMIMAKVTNVHGEDDIYGIYYGETYYASCHSLVLEENNLKDNQEMGAYLRLQPNWDAEGTVKLSAAWLNQLLGLAAE